MLKKIVCIMVLGMLIGSSLATAAEDLIAQPIWVIAAKGKKAIKREDILFRLSAKGGRFALYAAFTPTISKSVLEGEYTAVGGRLNLKIYYTANETLRQELSAEKLETLSIIQGATAYRIQKTSSGWPESLTLTDKQKRQVVFTTLPE